MVVRFVPFEERYSELMSEAVLHHIRQQTGDEGFTPEQAEVLAWHATPEEVARRARREETFVALQGDDFLGFVSRMSENTIGKIFTAPGHTHAIKRLLWYAEVLCLQEGANVIYISGVTPYRPARELFERVGYRFQCDNPMEVDGITIPFADYERTAVKGCTR